MKNNRINKILATTMATTILVTPRTTSSSILRSGACM
ncbi:hypothetical protein J2Z43_002597 [Clostridioides mangenotii]|uniref:Uncharacterized protein n=1 Tax=Metaclostridioides mangenotii TaxID=1540 RepID=A0ABS4EDZ7_9FIRM|nr:hypothetical protein [Clostridioides mangenotii]